MKIYKSEKAKRNILGTYDKLLAKWNVSIEERDISSTYGTTHVIVAGDQSSPPLVLFHGVGDDSALMWLYNAKSLATRFRIYAIDTIGGPGKSIPGVGYDLYFDDAKWIDSVLDALRLSVVYIIGTSHGAYLAQYYAAMRSDRVKRIICLAGSVPVGGGNPMKTMIKIFLPEALFPTKRNTARLIRKLCGANNAMFLNDSVIMEHYRWLLKGFNNMAMRYHKVKSLTDEQIDAIRPIALYLVGDDDPFQKLGGKEALLRYSMRCKFYDHVGHGINHEIADKINNAIHTELREIDFI